MQIIQAILFIFVVNTLNPNLTDSLLSKALVNNWRLVEMSQKGSGKTRYDHPVRYIKIISFVDIPKFEKKYKIGAGKVGRSLKSIRLMLGVILYAIYSRIYSAHQIDMATYTYSDFLCGKFLHFSTMA